MKKSIFNISTLALITLLVSFGISGFVYADEEALGQAAEVEGKFRQALTHYVEALKTDATNQQLRVKIIKLAQKIQPPPRVPEQAERYLARGEAAVESAQDDHGFNLAVDEFTSALQIAPWVADIYFNLGVVLDKAGQYDAAISNLNLYLIAMPHDKDAKKLKYKIEFRQEKAGRKRKAEAKKPRFPKPADLAGYWRTKNSSKPALVTPVGNWLEFDRFDRDQYDQYISAGIKFRLNRLQLEDGISSRDNVPRQSAVNPPVEPPFSCFLKLRRLGGYNKRSMKVRGTVSRDWKTIVFRFRELVHLRGCRLGYEDFTLTYYR